MVRALIPIVALLPLSSCGIPGSMVERIDANQYRGDGTIGTCSNIFGGGYRIDFPPFDATRTYDASYRVSHLPPPGKEWPEFELGFSERGPRDVQKRMKSVTAISRLTLRDTNGNILWSEAVRFSALRVGFGATGLSYVNAFQNNPVRFKRDVSYTLTMSYSPGAVPPPTKQLHLAINNCSFY
jgi:hypothetical protein